MYITNIFGNFVQVTLTQPLKVKTLANWSIRATIASLSYQDPLESWSAFFIKKIADLLYQLLLSYISYILLSVVYIFPTFSSQIYFYNKETCSNIKSYTTIIVLNMSGALNEKS